MPHRHSRRKVHVPSEPNANQDSPPRREVRKPSRERLTQDWDDLRTSKLLDMPASELMKLIEQDAPLRHHSGLVLMYGPFQAEMATDQSIGVASWLRECVRKHGLPSLVRYDHRHRAQVFRRDQFQPWLEPMLTKLSS